MNKRIIFFQILIISLLIISVNGQNIINNDFNKNDFIEEKMFFQGEKAIKINKSYQKSFDNKFLTNIQITNNELDESHPSLDIDYQGNPFIMYHLKENLFNSILYLQRSLDKGETWPDDLKWYYEFDDITPINPDINFVDGIRSFGTFETEELEPRLYFYDFFDIDDPDTWNLYSFDRSNSASYVTDTAVAANSSGRIALASIQDYESDEYYQDTILITWDADNFDDQTADGGVYWLNNDDDGHSIPYSNLCADAGDKIFFVFQRQTQGGTKQISTAYCKVDENTLYSDWRQSSVATSSRYNYTYPDISVSGKKAYVTYMGDENGNNDIFVASSTTGNFWMKYQVTDTPDEEKFPVISANGDELTILFMRNGNIFKTNSEDSGKTWTTPEQINDVSNTVSEKFQNSDVKGTYGIWTDNRNNNDDLFFETVGLSPQLIIDEVQGGLGIKVKISNVGNAPAENINWDISLDGGLILFGSTSEGTDTIEIGESITIKAFVFGFGQVSITIKIDDITQSYNGLVIGPFVINIS